MPTLHNGPIDALLNAIRGGTTLRVLTEEPGSLEEAKELTLGSVSVTAGDYGPITDYAGGRQVAGPVVSVPITGTATARYLSIDNGSELLHVNPIAPADVSAGQSRSVSYGTIRVPHQGTSA